MGWRTVVVSKSSKLDYKSGYMVVRDSEETICVHISEISVLIIENQKMFETNEYESVIVLDEDLCEIVEI